jgi:hypothetical protein
VGEVKGWLATSWGKSEVEVTGWVIVPIRLSISSLAVRPWTASMARRSDSCTTNACARLTRVREPHGDVNRT